MVITSKRTHNFSVVCPTTAENNNKDRKNVKFAEYSGFGAPTVDDGTPGDVYIDVRTCEAYGRVCSGPTVWKAWPGPFARKEEQVVHPVYRERVLFVTPNLKGISWMSRVESIAKKNPGLPKDAKEAVQLVLKNEEDAKAAKTLKRKENLNSGIGDQGDAKRLKLDEDSVSAMPLSAGSGNVLSPRRDTNGNYDTEPSSYTDLSTSHHPAPSLFTEPVFAFNRLTIDQLSEPSRSIAIRYLGQFEAGRPGDIRHETKLEPPLPQSTALLSTHPTLNLHGSISASSTTSGLASNEAYLNGNRTNPSPVANERIPMESPQSISPLLRMHSPPQISHLERSQSRPGSQPPRQANSPLISTTERLILHNGLRGLNYSEPSYATSVSYPPLVSLDGSTEDDLISAYLNLDGYGVEDDAGVHSPLKENEAARVPDAEPALTPHPTETGIHEEIPSSIDEAQQGSNSSPTSESEEERDRETCERPADKVSSEEKNSLSESNQPRALSPAPPESQSMGGASDGGASLSTSLEEPKTSFAPPNTSEDVLPAGPSEIIKGISSCHLGDREVKQEPLEPCLPGFQPAHDPLTDLQLEVLFHASLKRKGIQCRLCFLKGKSRRHPSDSSPFELSWHVFKKHGDVYHVIQLASEDVLMKMREKFRKRQGLP